MQRKEFLKFMEENKGKDIEVEVNEKILGKMSMQEYRYEIVEDKIYFRNKTDLNFIVINLNTVRNIKESDKSITIYLDDKVDTEVKISVI